MSETILVAFVTGGLALLGTVLSNRKSAALIAYRLEQLESKVEKHNRMVERIADIVRTMTHDMRHESVQLMLESGRGEELYQAHEKLYRILSTRDVEGVYGEIRSTYFVPDAENQVIALSEKT